MIPPPVAPVAPVGPVAPVPVAPVAPPPDPVGPVGPCVPNNDIQAPVPLTPPDIVPDVTLTGTFPEIVIAFPFAAAPNPGNARIVTVFRFDSAKQGPVVLVSIAFTKFSDVKTLSLFH